jgi:hypothetical protein
MASVDRAGAPALRATRNAGMLSLNSEPASISGSQLIKHPSAFHVAYYCNGSYSATDRSRFLHGTSAKVLASFSQLQASLPIAPPDARLA